MCRKHLKGADGDRVNAVLAAPAGHNFAPCAGSRSSYAIWRTLLEPFFI
jgi:hypothetical protein